MTITIDGEVVERLRVADLEQIEENVVVLNFREDRPYQVALTNAASVTVNPNQCDSPTVTRSPAATTGATITPTATP